MKIPIFLAVISLVTGSTIFDVVHLACQRNPKLSLCQAYNVTSNPPDHQNQAKDYLINRSHQNRTFSANTRRDTKPIDESDRLETIRVSHEDVELLRSVLSELHREHHRDGDFRTHLGVGDEKERINWTEDPEHRQTAEGKGDIFGDFEDPSSSDNREEKSRVEQYCNTYQENYAFYCLGGINEKTHLLEHLRKFCPSYEVNCPTKVAKYSRPSTLSEIQTEKASLTGNEPSPFPDVAAIAAEVESPELKALKKIRPCTPDCDHRVWKHCTQECKCDWIYPYVQRFCNPPPIPFFLNTCRLWYYSCPKYERYHYASQFVYSKAEKGKVLPGQPVPRSWPSGPNPYANAQRYDVFGGAQLPGQAVTGLSGGETTGVASGPGQASSTTGQAPTNPFLQKDFIENREQRDEISRQILRNMKKAKALQANIVPVVPSDASFASGSVPPSSGFAAGDIHQFDAYTDRRGVLHRPRSRSPFTKPGLWEPNPDNPHNRDHANKWFYEPKSVGVDWLNGQVTWGGHWAVPAAGVGGTNGYSALFFPTLGNFLNIADDYD